MMQERVALDQIWDVLIKPSRVPDALQRATLLRRAGTHLATCWGPALQRITDVLGCVRGTRAARAESTSVWCSPALSPQ
jgi:hypothetical protein